MENSEPLLDFLISTMETKEEKEFISILFSEIDDESVIEQLIKYEEIK